MKNTIQAGSYPLDIPSARASHVRLTGDAGQSLVELALTLPLFMLILLGAAEFARFAWASIEAENAARAGVQYGAQNHTMASDTPRIKGAALLDGTNLSGLTATTSNYCVCSTATSTPVACPTTLTTPTCAAPANILEYVQVNTSATVTPLYRWPGLPTTFTARGFAIMEVEQW
jgi:hypothetical protein